MPARIVFAGIFTVLMASFMVYSIELFIPLAKKSDMNMYCRSALLKMESSGCFNSIDREVLTRNLADSGLENIVIQATDQAKLGDEVNLNVEADLCATRLAGLFYREGQITHMTYNKTSISRKVIN